MVNFTESGEYKITIEKPNDANISFDTPEYISSDGWLSADGAKFDTQTNFRVGYNSTEIEIIKFNISVTGNDFKAFVDPVIYTGLNNSDFETGDFSSWTDSHSDYNGCFSTTTIVPATGGCSGSYCARLHSEAYVANCMAVGTQSYLQQRFTVSGRNLSMFLNYTITTGGNVNAAIYIRLGGNVLFTDSVYGVGQFKNFVGIKSFDISGYTGSNVLELETYADTYLSGVNANADIWVDNVTDGSYIFTNESRIYPSPYVHENQTILCYANGTINSTTIGYYYMVYLNGTLNYTGNTSFSFLNATEYNIHNITNNISGVGNNWTFSILASDGTRNASSWANYSTVTVQNQNITAITITPPGANDTDDLTVNMTATWNLNLTHNWTINWVKNGVSLDIGTFILGKGNFTSGDKIACEICLNDTLSRICQNSSNMTIGDATLPTIYNIYTNQSSITSGNIGYFYVNATDANGIVSIVGTVNDSSMTFKENITFYDIGSNIWRAGKVLNTVGITSLIAVFAYDGSGNAQTNYTINTTISVTSAPSGSGGDTGGGGSGGASYYKNYDIPYYLGEDICYGDECYNLSFVPIPQYWSVPVTPGETRVVSMTIANHKPEMINISITCLGDPENDFCNLVEILDSSVVVGAGAPQQARYKDATFVVHVPQNMSIGEFSLILESGGIKRAAVYKMYTWASIGAYIDSFYIPIPENKLGVRRVAWWQIIGTGTFTFVSFVVYRILRMKKII
jgi:hypothetical protein